MSSNVKEIKREPRNAEVLQLLELITHQLKHAPDATELLVFTKIGGEYYRFSTGIEDIMQLVAMLELAKHDTLQRMGA